MLNDSLQKSLTRLGYEPLTEIQLAAFPIIMAGKDVYALSPTGTGKTAAFAIPITERVLKNGKYLAVVIEPSREMVIQTANECRRIAEGLGVNVVAAYGGTDLRKQEDLLKKGANVVVGTPERLRDLMNKSLLAKPDLVVLDEADRVLGDQFTRDLFHLAENFRKSQTVMFSVQMPKPLLGKAERIFRKKFEQLKVGTVAGKTVAHSYVVAENPEKTLAKLVKDNPVKSMVFCATAVEANAFSRLLKSYGLHPLVLHSHLSADRRNSAVRQFKKAVDLLVCTDLAARGVHISNVKRIYSLGLPPHPEFYLHRAGRTGRMNETGESIAVIRKEDLKKLQSIYAAVGINPSQ